MGAALSCEEYQSLTDAEKKNAESDNLISDYMNHRLKMIICSLLGFPILFVFPG